MKEHFYWVGLIICVFFVMFSLSILSSMAASQESAIVIQISNPYSFNVEVEVKCDWVNEKHEFDFHRKLVFMAGQVTRVEIPKTQRNCELWPYVQLFE